MTTAEMTRELNRLERKVKAAHTPYNSRVICPALRAISDAKYAMKASNYTDDFRIITFEQAVALCKIAA